MKEGGSLAMTRKKSGQTNIMLRIAMLLLCMVIISTYFTSGLYAKYTVSKSGSDTARVAKWDVSATGGKPALAIDCSTSVMEDTYQVTVKNTSEVTAKYDIVVTFTQALPTNLSVNLDGNQTATLSSDRKVMTFSNAGQLASVNASKTHTLHFVADATKVEEDLSYDFQVSVNLVQID